MEHINKKPRGKANGIDRVIGRAIRTRRVEMGLSQQELADKINVTYQQVHKYETGVNRISCGTMFEIAKALKVKAGYFFEQLDSTDEGAPTNGALALMRTYSALPPPAHQAMVRQHAQVLAGGVE